MKTITIGRNYQHETFGGVTVDKIEGDQVHFTTRSGSGIKVKLKIRGFISGIMFKHLYQ